MAGMVASSAQMLLLALLMLGEQIFRALGYDTPPPAVAWLTANRMGAMGLYFALGMAGGAMSKTGAFEVTLDGELLYSALREGGRVPSVASIALALARAGVQPAPQFEGLIRGAMEGSQ